MVKKPIATKAPAPSAAPASPPASPSPAPPSPPTPPAASAPALATKPCSSCGVDIAATAKVCHNCKSSQQPWREELKYWGGLTSLGTAIVSGITFTGALALTVYQVFFAPAVTATEIDSQGQSVVWSTQKVWVDTFNARSERPYFDLGWQIHQVIAKPEEPLRFELSQMAGCQWQGRNGDLFDGGGVGDYVVNLPKDQFEARINQPQIDARYVPVILLTEGAEYKQLTAAKIGISEIPFSCSFSYTRLDTGAKGEQSVSCVGVLKDHIPGPPGATGVCNSAVAAAP